MNLSWLWKVRDSRLYPLFLSVSSALLLGAGWPILPFPFLLFLGFIPLLYLEEEYAHKDKWGGLFGYAYLSFLIWNLLTTWWVINSTVSGAIMAFLANSFLMCIPFLMFSYTKRITNEWVGYVSLPAYWIAFEYLHMNWDLSWPWLTLGNGFASAPILVQWYEYTGVFGGSLWILAVNILLFLLIRNYMQERNYAYWPPILLFALPIIFSIITYFNYTDQGTDVEIALIQPNVDPFTEKFEGSPKFVSYEKQLNDMIELANMVITDNTSFVLFPETALARGYWENQLEEYPDISHLGQLVKLYPHLNIIVGIDSYVYYPDKKSAPATARFSEQIGYHDICNTALFISEKSKLETYHKSKLVPGVEQMPFPALFKILEPLAINLGGSTGTLGKQDYRSVFTNVSGISAAPVVCYESIYGEFVADFVRNGPGFIAIITNDGWWGNTPGHKQHLAYASLRAIETRKSIARSANTGISGFINQRGDIVRQTEWWKMDAISGVVKSNKIITFYVQWGDYIGKFCGILSVIIIGFTLYNTASKKWLLPKKN